ncbi:hypothetical protein V6N13_001690 [Hibiscus sabdariffa]
MRNKENNVASNPSKSALVASNGTAVQVYSSLSKLNHVAVRVIDDDLGGVLSNLNWRSMSGPIRNSGSKSLNHSIASVKSLYKRGPRA